ncbi:hypothetical protein GCM10018954_073520 [Kutzneria kofuensis]
MDEMTSDMGGAAAVVATVMLAAKLKYPLEVVATVPMAENMPSGDAYRPGDVLTMYGGKTVEVLNTDAEGRLILADAIVRACEDNPDYLIDTATLTGAQLVALGKRTSGVMGTDEFPGPGHRAGQRRRREQLGHADARGAAVRPGLPAGGPGPTSPATGSAACWRPALFLREFVPADLPWAHIDVAGPAYNSGGAHGYTTKGGTGVPVRTIAAVLADIAANG